MPYSAGSIQWMVSLSIPLHNTVSWLYNQGCATADRYGWVTSSWLWQPWHLCESEQTPFICGLSSGSEGSITTRCWSKMWGLIKSSFRLAPLPALPETVPLRDRPGWRGWWRFFKYGLVRKTIQIRLRSLIWLQNDHKFDNTGLSECHSLFKGWLS